MRTVGELDDVLRQAGIPIIGVTLHRRGPPAISSIRFAPEATQQQRDQGNTIREAFDWEAPAQILEAVTAAVAPAARRVARRAKKKTATK